MYKAIIFDVDGVLMDSVPYHYAAWEKTFHEHDIPFTYDDYLTKVNGLPRITGVRNIVPNASDSEVEKLAEKKQSYFLKAIEESAATPLPGVVMFLKTLQKKKIPFVAASSSKNARTLLEAAQIADYFHAIITGNDFTHPKPHPDIFLTAAEKLALSPTECVVIEDAIHGIHAAKNAGMGTVGLLSSHDTEIGKTADISISSLTEFPRILTTFFTDKKTDTNLT